MSYHIELALKKAEEAEKRGDTKEAERWYGIAEKYEKYLKQKEK